MLFGRTLIHSRQPMHRTPAYSDLAIARGYAISIRCRASLAAGARPMIMSLETSSR